MAEEEKIVENNDMREDLQDGTRENARENGAPEEAVMPPRSAERRRTSDKAIANDGRVRTVSPSAEEDPQETDAQKRARAQRRARAKRAQEVRLAREEQREREERLTSEPNVGVVPVVSTRPLPDQGDVRDDGENNRRTPRSPEPVPEREGFFKGDAVMEAAPKVAEEPQRQAPSPKADDEAPKSVVRDAPERPDSERQEMRERTDREEHPAQSEREARAKRPARDEGPAQDQRQRRPAQPAGEPGSESDAGRQGERRRRRRRVARPQTDEQFTPAVQAEVQQSAVPDGVDVELGSAVMPKPANASRRGEGQARRRPAAKRPRADQKVGDSEVWADADVTEEQEASDGARKAAFGIGALSGLLGRRRAKASNEEPAEPLEVEASDSVEEQGEQAGPNDRVQDQAGRAEKPGSEPRPRRQGQASLEALPTPEFDEQPAQADAEQRRTSREANGSSRRTGSRRGGRTPEARVAPQRMIEQGRSNPLGNGPARSKPARRFPLFWLCYGILVIALIGFAAVAMIYTYDSLVRYENAQPNSYIQGVVNDLKAGGKAAEVRRAQCIRQDNIGEYDSIDMLNARFDQGVGRESYRVEEGGVAFDTSAPIYTIYADEKPFLTVHLEPANTYGRLGLLSITDWDITHVLLHTDGMPEKVGNQVDEGLSYDVSVPSNAAINVNGKQLAATSATESAPMPGFEYASQFVDVPVATTYHVAGLVSEPEVSATNFEGAAIPLNRTATGFAASTLATPNREPEDLPIDPLKIAESWSLFMTNDLDGGVSQVTQYLIPGSELYNQATSFANGIDITFVWSHSFTGFSDESVTNCIMYNDSLFSCDVRCNKNMTLGGGESRTDEFANTMIFAYVNDPTVVDTPGWYLVNMQAITSEDSNADGALPTDTGAAAAGVAGSATTTNGTNGTMTNGTATNGTTTTTGVGTTTNGTTTNGTTTTTGVGTTTNGTVTNGTTVSNGTDTTGMTDGTTDGVAEDTTTTTYGTDTYGGDSYGTNSTGVI